MYIIFARGKGPKVLEEGVYSKRRGGGGSMSFLARTWIS
jgi:hypothetical protein